MKTLQRHLAHQRALKDRVGARYHDEGLMFARAEEHLTTREDDCLGMPLRAGNVRNAVKAFATAAKLRPVRLHSFRHTNASHLVLHVPLAIAAQRLGMSIATLNDTYQHPAGDGERAGVAALHAMFSKGLPGNKKGVTGNKKRLTGNTKGNKKTGIREHRTA